MHTVLVIYILLISLSAANSSPYFTSMDLNKTLISFENASLSFKYLQSDHNLIYIGTWNSLYSVPIQNVSVLQLIIYWPETSCSPKRANCGNYIEIMAKVRGAMILCGTYGDDPKCQKFGQDGHKWIKTGELMNGDSIVTSSAQSPWSGVHFYKDYPQRLYAATYIKNNVPVLRAKYFDNGTIFISEQNPKMFFNQPVFKAMFEFNEKIYVFFNEESLENENFWTVSSFKYKKQSIARIGRVCLNDFGYKMWDLPENQKYFTTFFKTQLLCSIENKLLGDVIIFNKIVAISSLGPDNLLYVLMAYDTPLVRLSAVCAYRMSDVEYAFATGRQLMLKSNSGEGKPPYWVKVDEAVLHAAKIINATECNIKRDMEAAEFILNNPLLASPVRPIGGRPLVLLGGLSTSRHSSFSADSDNNYHIPYHVHGSLASAINVLFDVQASDDSRHDVLLLGTEDGAVIKIALPPIPQSASSAHGAADAFGSPASANIKLPTPILVEIVQLLKPGRLIYTLEANKRHNRIMAIHPQQLASLPLARCEFFDSCAKCVALRDPFCSWHVDFQRCIQQIDFGISNMSSGLHSGCGHTKDESTTKSSLPPLTSASLTTLPTKEVRWTVGGRRLPNPFRARSTKLVTMTSVMLATATERPSQYARSINFRVSEAKFSSKGETNNYISMGIFLGVLISLLVLTFFIAFFVGYICARRVYHKKRAILLAKKGISSSVVVDTKNDLMSHNHSQSSFEYRSCTLKERSQSEAHCSRGDVLGSPGLLNICGSRAESLGGPSRQLARPNDYETSNNVAVFPSVVKLASKPQHLVVSLSATPYNMDKVPSSSPPLMSQFAQSARLHKPYKTSIEQPNVLPILQPRFPSQHLVSPAGLPGWSAHTPSKLELDLDSPVDPLRIGLQYVDADSAEEEERQLEVVENGLSRLSYFTKPSFNQRVAAVPMLDRVDQSSVFCDLPVTKHPRQRPDSTNLDAYLDISPDIGFNLSNCSSFSNMSSMLD